MYQSVTNVLRYVRALLSSARNQAARIFAAVEEDLSRFLAEGQVLALATLLEVLIARVVHEEGLAEAAEQDHLEQVRLLKAVRKRRDKAQAALYRLLVTVRSLIETALGQGEASGLVGLDAGLNRVGFEDLRRYGRTAHGILGNPGRPRRQVQSLREGRGAGILDGGPQVALDHRLPP